MGQIGLVSVETNDDLERARAARDAEGKPAAPPRHITELAAHIRACFQQARDFRAEAIDARLLDCKRRRKGEYNPTDLEEIAQLGGCTKYFNLTATKIQAAKVRIKDVLRREQTWKLVPTPEPDLPEDAQTRIRQQVLHLRQADIDASTLGQLPAPGHDEYHALFDRMYDAEQQAMDDVANDAADALAEKVRDQLIEGGWHRAIDDLVDFVVTYPSATFRGLVVKPVKRLKWQAGTPTVVTESVPTWAAPDPNDIFPAANAKQIDDGDVCEWCWVSNAELGRMRDQPGWNADEINAVLDDPSASTGVQESSSELTRASIEERDTAINDGGVPNQKRAVIYWGSVAGKMLTEWGMNPPDGQEIDEHTWYDIEAMLVGEHVVRAVFSPDPLGKKPYYWTSARKVAGQLWGEAISEAMADCQDGYGACYRHMENNLALASGPQIDMDVDSVDEKTGTEVYPWKVWQWHSTRALNGKPVNFTTIPINATQYLEIAEKYAQQADDRTLIPRYTYGNERVGGAGETASGLRMLLAESDKGTKEIIANIDLDITCPAIEQLCRWNMWHLPDEKYAPLKGDIRVQATGIVAAMIHDELQDRRSKYLADANNPVDLQIVRPKHRRNLWLALAKDLGLPADDVVATEDEMDQAEMAQAQQQQMLAEQGGSGDAPVA